MKATEMTDFDLDTLLSAARKADALPSEALQARVMSDAMALQPKQVPPVAAQAVSVGWIDRLSALFGGGGALAGVSLALVAGVFIGVIQPEPVAALTSALMAEAQMDSVDLLPDAATLWEEVQDD